MNKKVSTLAGRRDDPFPGRLNLCLEDRSLVHVLSGLRSSDLALPREAQTIEARQRFLSATFCSIAIVFDGLDGYQCDEPDIGPEGFDAIVLGGLWSLCSQLYPTILTRYDDSAHQVMEAHLEAVLEGNAAPLIILCPEHRRADWQTWFEAKKDMNDIDPRRCRVDSSVVGDALALGNPLRSRSQANLASSIDGRLLLPKGKLVNQLSSSSIRLTNCSHSAPRRPHLLLQRD
jgi:hypothetical protein